MRPLTSSVFSLTHRSRGVAKFTRKAPSYMTAIA